MVCYLYLVQMLRTYRTSTFPYLKNDFEPVSTTEIILFPTLQIWVMLLEKLFHCSALIKYIVVIYVSHDFSPMLQWGSTVSLRSVLPRNWLRRVAWNVLMPPVQ